MATKKLSQLTVLDTVNANLVLTVIPVYDISSNTTRKVTLQQINDSIEANIPFAAAAFTQANTPSQVANSGSSYANAAFLKANTATTDAANADSKAVSSGVYANASFGVANTANLNSISAGVYANAAFAVANSGITDSWARDSVNAASSYANSGFSKANTANTLAQAAYDYANTIVIIDSWARDSVNSSSSYGNSAFSIANTANTNSISAGEYANAAFAAANTGGTDSWARDAANSASSYSNSSYSQANTANVLAQAAFDTANNISSNVTGNISIASTNSAINFVSNSSGDGFGASTMQLVPDENLTGTDQYLIIDPTAPGHIHIRAGGTQDDSGAELFLGGENSHVKIGGGLNPPVTIKSNAYSWTFDVNGELTVPGKIYFDNGIESALTLDQFGIRANTQLTLSAENYVTGNNSTILFDKNGSGITFRLEDNTPVSKNWGFYQNKLTFPDSTEQTTAYTGSAGSYANSAYTVANTADQRAVTSGSYANSAYSTANTFSGFVSGNNLSVSGNVVVTGNVVTSKIVYATNTAVTQTTSRGTGVSLNNTSGQVTLYTATMTSEQVDAISVTNNKVRAGDVILTSIEGGSIGTYVSGGYCSVDGIMILWITNITSSTTGSESPTIRFVIIQPTNV